MISLEEFVSTKNVSNNDNYINEGFWSNLTKWFDKFFSISDKDFDRYGKDGIDAIEYNKYLTDNFRKRYLSLKKINENILSNILYPNDSQPSEQSNQGFWDFLDEPIKPTGHYYMLTYEDKHCKDVVALIKVNEYLQLYNNCAELIKIQILDEFQRFVSFKTVIEYLYEDVSITHNGLFVKQSQNKKLYEYVINDCNYTKGRYMTSENIAYKKFE